MDFPTPLLRGRLVHRYKRFFADVDLDDDSGDGGGIVTAHCPNPGAMLGLTTRGLTAWVSRPPDPKRKLQYTLEMVETDGGLVGINTLHPNRLAAEAIADGRIAELAGYPGLRREVKYAGDSRIDILLDDPARPPCWVEVKNVHFLRQPGLAEFPDCRTERGVKHLKALERMAAEGHRAVMLFVVQRMDASRFDTADDVDKAYGPALREAATRGVEVLCYGCHLSPEAIRLDRRIPWRAEGRVQEP